jgi:RNA polymerase sigma-70 factor (ECF subfamily)
VSAPPASSSPAPRLSQPPGDRVVADSLARTGKGSRAALADLYQCTAPQVFGLISLMLGDASAAKETTAAVYQQVWHTAARYDPARGSATAWVLAVAHGQAVRQLQAHRKTAAPPVGSAATELAPLAGISRAAGLQHLDVSARELILLVYYRGYSAAQAAALLSLPIETVASRLREALSRA